jgi:hypothetical protein
MSQTFAPGRHTLVLSLAEGASVDRLRIERKKGSQADYVATVRRLGFDPGPQGAVSRGKALDAMRFVRDQRRALLSALCGDRVLIEESPTSLPTQIASGVGTVPSRPGQGGAGGVDVPLPPPLLPPQPPSSPTTP